MYVLVVDVKKAAGVRHCGDRGVTFQRAARRAPLGARARGSSAPQQRSAAQRDKMQCARRSPLPSSARRFALARRRNGALQRAAERKRHRKLVALHYTRTRTRSVHAAAAAHNTHHRRRRRLNWPAQRATPAAATRYSHQPAGPPPSLGHPAKPRCVSAAATRWTAKR